MLCMSVQVLTLANNERIPLTPSMRLLFEISHLKHATPATVSRAGILYINPQELSWNLWEIHFVCKLHHLIHSGSYLWWIRLSWTASFSSMSRYVTSWIDRRERQTERAHLTILFDKYIPRCIEKMRCSFKTIIPITENSMVQVYHSHRYTHSYRPILWFSNLYWCLSLSQTLCSLLDCLLTPENIPADTPREIYETYFVFACVWAFGGATFQDQVFVLFYFVFLFGFVFVWGGVLFCVLCCSVLVLVLFVCLFLFLGGIYECKTQKLHQDWNWENVYIYIYFKWVLIYLLILSTQFFLWIWAKLS